MPRRSPFDDIESVFDRMNRQFEELGRQLEGEFHGDITIDLAETDEEVVVVADLPGFSSEEIDVSVIGRELTLSAEREERHEHIDEDEPERNYHRRERTQRQMTRRVRLPADVVEEDADATYNNGVLTVTLPKRTVADSSGTQIDVE